MSVVLPAPFGPITAWISPLLSASETWSVATRPPNNLQRSTVSTSGPFTAPSQEQASDAAALVQGHENEQRPEDELPVFGEPRERFFEHHERDSAGHGPDHRAGAPEDDHDDQV